MKNAMSASLQHTRQDVQAQLNDMLHDIKHEAASCKSLIEDSMKGEGIDQLALVISLERSKNVDEAVPTAVSSIGIKNLFFYR
ncbi:hypothetical protein A2U94_12200 [Bacillus sp. VT 712]|nr:MULTISPECIES: hypothetical protein [Bacillaceae]KZB91128.1 hypothetical protein A2U94_12200 [Bacillus sp. VT 712]MBN8433062.1 hypothetical protein [Priestia flexa]MCA0965588.1 hypothetical protein [Priestia flexa]